MKQIRTVRHSFNTTGMANYSVQLAVPLQLKITIIITILFSKKVNKQVHCDLTLCTTPACFSTFFMVPTLVENSYYFSVNQLKLLYPYCAFYAKKEMHSRDTAVLIDLL